MTKSYTNAIVLIVGSILQSLPATVYSEDREQADVPGQLAEIVITATKRSSTVQDTPISVTAVSGAEILDRGLSDFRSLAQSIPGLSMRTSGAGQTEFEMRGMTSGGGNSATVGFYLADTPLSAPSFTQNGKVVIDPNLYDLNRVEVLRGPQGTLYGSGSMGGTIKLIPNAPDPRAPDASAQVVFSDTDGGGFNRKESAMVNLPLGDTFALRIVGTDSHDSGWIDRIVVAPGAFPLETNGNTTRGNVAAAPVLSDYQNVNTTKLSAVRVSLLWRPIEQLEITPSFFYQRIQQDGLSDIDSYPGTNAHYQPFDTPEPFSDRFNLSSVNVAYRFDGFDLNSTTSYWNRSEDVRQDGTEEIQWALSTPAALLPFYPNQGGIGANSPASLENDRSKQTSEELRLISSGDTQFKWLVGYFYSDFESNFNLYVNFPSAVPVFGTGNGFLELQPTKIIQNSVFGEISYQLTPQLKATAGLRRYAYNSSVSTAVSGFLSSTGSDTVAYSATGERDKGVNPKFDLSYQPNKDLLLYATIAKGFRPGGGNQPVPTAGTLGDVCEADLQANHGTTAFVAAPLAYKPDDVLSYEIGEKAKVLERRLTINSAVYFEQWRGVQQNIPLACGFPYTDNSGDAHIYGAEIEMAAALSQDFTLNANVGYTHATFVVGSLEAGITAGTRVQDVPSVTSSVSLVYQHPITSSITFTSRIENNYVGNRTDATYAVNNLPAYDLTDLRFGALADRWKVFLFARNLFNKRSVLSDATQININIPTFNREALATPLTVGVDLSYHFGRP
jgi:outer membrane receptor protein involved in Fe transport